MVCPHFSISMVKRSAGVVAHCLGYQAERTAIPIRHTMTICTVDGRYTIVAADITKFRDTQGVSPDCGCS